MLEGCQAEAFTYGILSDARFEGHRHRADANTTSLKSVQGQNISHALGPSSADSMFITALQRYAIGLARQAPIGTIMDILQSPPTVLGRLQQVQNPLGLKIYVDFAHSDDALFNVLECLQELKKGRIITVFGCGGDRDQTKTA